LAINKEPLIDERVEAWNYGPVIPSLYHEFKNFGSGAITLPATDFHFEGKKLSLVAPSIDDNMINRAMIRRKNY
jgi:uncharacterized phage-associated protein